MRLRDQALNKLVSFNDFPDIDNSQNLSIFGDYVSDFGKFHERNFWLEKLDKHKS